RQRGAIWAARAAQPGTGTGEMVFPSKRPGTPAMRPACHKLITSTYQNRVASALLTGRVTKVAGPGSSSTGMVMSNSASEKSTARADSVESTLYKKDFWSAENLKYSRPHYRMQKISRVINKLARGKECTLLDVGCGPAALKSLLRPNIE